MVMWQIMYAFNSYDHRAK